MSSTMKRVQATRVARIGDDLISSLNSEVGLDLSQTLSAYFQTANLLGRDGWHLFLSLLGLLASSRNWKTEYALWPSSGC